ncbi:hypothetical protein Q9V93_004107 [Salmonella enterica]|nr:hypothetical protein [Salmonella enterica]
MTITTVGIDLAKNVFAVHCVDQNGKTVLVGVVSENGIYGHSRFCNTDFDDKLACLNLSGV